MLSLPSEYKEALAWLYGTQRFGIKLGLENAARLFQELGVPGKEQRFLHVAGTNGKGSVCAMLGSICRAQGYRTGLFTSPHLVTYRERIQVNGEMISAREVATGLAMIREMVCNWEPHPTFFEITTALALLHFKERDCELVALETGLGGRLDTTNVIKPIVSVITPVGYDHQAWLGNSLEEIAREKAGIIKAGIPVVSAPQDCAAAEVIRARAAECEAPLEFVNDSFRTPLPLAGAHQQQNASLAIAALRAGGVEIEDRAVTEGLSNVRWPARFQRWDERTVIDGAHNPAGAEVLAQTWREQFGDDRATVVLGLLRDKDIAGIWRAVSPIAARVILPHIQTARAFAPEDLAPILSEISPSLQFAIAPSLPAALESARAGSERILVTGSLHFAGEVLAALRGDPAAFEECAQ